MFCSTCGAPDQLGTACTRCHAPLARPAAAVAAPRGAKPAQTGTILVLGILSICICGLLGPMAWSMGKDELARIDRGELPAAGRSSVQAGLTCGIIGTCVLVLQVLLLMAYAR